MNPLNRKLSLKISSLLALGSGLGNAGQSQGGPYTITRTLIGASGQTNLAGGDGYSAASAVGESAAGNTVMTDGPHQHMAGYYAGWIGNGRSFQLSGSQIPGAGPVVNLIQMGVSLQARIELDFTDQIDPTTL